MKKIFLILFLLLTIDGFSQITSPSSYTNHRLRLYSAHANPGSDSLNQNMIDIDNMITTIENAIKGNILKNPDSLKYVSSKFANDTNNYTFSTIQAAINASGVGTLVYVYPGTYNEADTGKNGVNIYLSAGAVLSYSSGSIPTFFTSGVTCTIYGEGLISQSYTGTIGSGAVHALKITNSSNITVNCNVSNYGVANESGNGARFGSVIYVKNSNLQFNEKFIYSKIGTALGFDSLSTAVITNATIKSQTSIVINVFSRRKINISNSYIGIDSSNLGYNMIAIKSDSSKLYLNNCIIERLDNSNLQQQGGAFVELVNTANRELERLYISNCKFYSWDNSPQVSPIYLIPSEISDVLYTTGTGTISKSANNDTVRGTGTSFVSQLIYTPNIISPFCLGTDYYGKIQTVLNDTTLVLTVASGSNPPNRLRGMEFTKCGYYYSDENGETTIDTSNYSVIIFSGNSWMPTKITGKIKIRGSYDYGLLSTKKMNELEIISSLNYKNRTLRKVLDGNVYIDSANAFLLKLNHNTSVSIIGTFTSPTPINMFVYRSDTTAYSLIWDTKIIWSEGITPPIPDLDMIDVYSFYAINFKDETINVDENLLFGTLIKSFPIPY